jgi:hypothetical protein
MTDEKKSFVIFADHYGGRDQRDQMFNTAQPAQPAGSMSMQQRNSLVFMLYNFFLRKRQNKLVRLSLESLSSLRPSI